MGWMRMSRVVLTEGVRWVCLSCSYIVGLGLGVRDGFLGMNWSFK